MSLAVESGPYVDMRTPCGEVDAEQQGTPQLPVEIIEIILENLDHPLRPPSRSLLACSLVSRLFFTLARPRIYASPVIVNESNAREFQVLLESVYAEWTMVPYLRLIRVHLPRPEEEEEEVGQDQWFYRVVDALRARGVKLYGLCLRGLQLHHLGNLIPLMDFLSGTLKSLDLDWSMLWQTPIPTPYSIPQPHSPALQNQSAPNYLLDLLRFLHPLNDTLEHLSIRGVFMHQFSEADIASAFSNYAWPTFERLKTLYVNPYSPGFPEAFRWVLNVKLNAGVCGRIRHVEPLRRGPKDLILPQLTHLCMSGYDTEFLQMFLGSQVCRGLKQLFLIFHSTNCMIPVLDLSPLTQLQTISVNFPGIRSSFEVQPIVQTICSAICSSSPLSTNANLNLETRLRSIILLPIGLGVDKAPEWSVLDEMLASYQFFPATGLPLNNGQGFVSRSGLTAATSKPKITLFSKTRMFAAFPLARERGMVKGWFPCAETGKGGEHWDWNSMRLGWE